MSTDGVGDSLSGGDGFDDLDSSMTGDLFESFEKAFLSMDLSELSSKSEKEIALVVTSFMKTFKRVVLIGLVILGVTTSLHLVNLIFVSPSAYSGYLFFGLLFLTGYLYPLRVIYGLIKSRSIFIFLKRKMKIKISILTITLVLSTAIGSYPVVRDYYNYFIDSPGSCYMLVDTDEIGINIDNVSCLSNRAFLEIHNEIKSGEECVRSQFGPYESWTGKWCLSAKRLPTEAEKQILGM